ncbi:recombinase family protein [Kitasatospora sp. NPDC057015]|uniref:recombinase family protein n=1 Tax=Kitasatospora sp. NPDC057015 TaxID=3346001 RepID=UPI003631B562
MRAQEAEGREWAARNHYRVRRVWVDNLSAWSDVARPGFDSALAAVLDDQVPALWCFALDRFTRKGIDDIGPVLGKARVIFHWERLDSSDPNDRRWIIDRAEQAREYSERLSYNIRVTKKNQLKNGQWSSRPPYGTEATKDRKLTNGTYWPVVLHIFRSLADGISARLLCKALNSGPRPVLSPKGGEWGVSTISYMIHNPVYEGWQTVKHPNDPRSPIPYRDQNGDRVGVWVGSAEPVPRELAERARRMLTAGNFPNRDAVDNRKRHLLTDITRCAGCRGAASADGRNHLCNRHKAGQSCPEPVSASRQLLEEWVVEAWFSRLNGADIDDPLLVIAAERWSGYQQPDNATKLADAVAGLAAAEGAVRRLAKQQADGFFDPPFDAHLPKLQAEARAALLTAKEKVAAATPKQLDVTWLLEDASIREAWQAAGHELRRELIRLLVRRVVVSKGYRGGQFDGGARIETHWLDEPDPWAVEDETPSSVGADGSHVIPDQEADRVPGHGGGDRVALRSELDSVGDLGSWLPCDRDGASVLQV